MGGYLQNYGAGEEHRNRIVKFIILGVLAALILSLAAYLLLHNRSEKKTVERFLAQVNSHDYKDAYVTWGCTEAHPCRNYDYARFLEDWGPKTKASSPWKIATVEGCNSFVTVNVKADGAELQSLGGLYLGESLGQIGIFAIFIAVVLFKPEGMFGARA